MALVSIIEAAKLVRKNRSTLYRDIEKGRLSKTVLPDGETRIETSELLRTYGHLHRNGADDAADEKLKIAILEERNRALERALALEAELRRVKDQVTNELRARLADKDSVIKVLQGEIFLLGHDSELKPASSQKSTDKAANRKNAREKLAPVKQWWARLLRKN